MLLFPKVLCGPECCCLASLGPESTEALRPEQRDSAHLNPCLDLVGTSLSWGFVFSWVLRLSRASPKEGPSVLMNPVLLYPVRYGELLAHTAVAVEVAAVQLENQKPYLPWLLTK